MLKPQDSFSLKLRKTADIGQNGKPTNIRKTDTALFAKTEQILLDALEYCSVLFWDNLEYLRKFPSTDSHGVPSRKRAAESLIHSSSAKYQKFDEKYPFFPSGLRRRIVSDALAIAAGAGQDWDSLKDAIPDRYPLNFPESERDLTRLSSGILGLKLYDGTDWGWHYFLLRKYRARSVGKSIRDREILPLEIVEHRGKLFVRVCLTDGTSSSQTSSSKAPSDESLPPRNQKKKKIPKRSKKEIR